jgi:hypothetical protein
MLTTKTYQITSNRLAWFVEGAHGQQHKTMYIVDDGSGELVMTDVDPRPEKEPLLEVTTTCERKELQAPKQVVIELQSGQTRKLLNDPDYPKCDALFWSASSIEKFLFPYYHSHRLYSHAEICGLMSQYRANSKLVAAVHVAPSRPGSINGLNTAGFFLEDGKDMEFVSFAEFLR